MQFVKCEGPFTTADAESIEIHFVGDQLDVRFVDIREKLVGLAFLEAVAFRWDPLGGEGAPRDDEPYEVIESPWIAALVAGRELDSAAGYRHFKLCFNAASVLDVVAREMHLQPGPAAPGHATA